MRTCTQFLGNRRAVASDTEERERSALLAEFGYQFGGTGMLSLNVNQDGGELLKQQIDGCRMRPGTRLPSIRMLADAHGIGCFTVVKLMHFQWWRGA